MERETDVARLSPGARAFLAVVLAVSLWTSTSRFVDPVGDAHVTYLPPGGADFYYPYFGARALLLGVNPYHHALPELADPWGREREAVDEHGVVWRQLYPPSHFILDVPLALIAGPDARLAARIFVTGSLVALCALAGVTVAFARRVGALPDGDVPALVAGALTLALAASPGIMLGLERGQSDLVLALCHWAGALLVLRRRAGPGLFLLSIPVLCKGYTALAAGGVLALALRDPSTRRGALLGVGAAALVFVLPVSDLLADAAAVTRFRANMFWPVPYNHSFKNLAHWLDPALADRGRAALTVLALASAGLCFVPAWRASGPAGAAPGGASEARRLTWLTLFMTCAIVVMLGWSSVSFSYNLAYVLPGVVILGLAPDRLGALAGLPARAVGALTAAAAACVSLPRIEPPPSIPIAAVGLTLLAALGAACGGAWSWPGPRTAHA